MRKEVLGASFRDPSGFVFVCRDLIHRQVNRRYAADYDFLLSSGLYDKLTRGGLLLAHAEVDGPLTSVARDEHYRTLLPEQLDFVSHPYEWCFSQLKEAALLTLRVQRMALAAGMTLKDGSAYNVQFQRGQPVFIDTLSFERRREGEAWVGYRQFCQHFLATLALMSLRDVRLSQLLRVHLDGIPLDLAVSLLPKRAWLRPGLLMHLRLHAGFQRRHGRAGKVESPTAAGPAKARKLGERALENLVASLTACVSKLTWQPSGTEWVDYYERDGYEAGALAHKQAVVEEYLRAIAPRTVWDLGANTGVYSRIAVASGARVVAFDVDPACVERNYLEVREKREEDLLPLLLDLSNPSPGIGWANDERPSIAGRGRPDVVLALALVHHLAISNNVPLASIADYFADLSDQLVIEFVPKSDAKVQLLLATRRDVFPGYTREGFEGAFATRYQILDRQDVEGSGRTLYRMGVRDR